MRLVLLGPPGAGKGTQASVLSKEFNVLHISTGDLLRDAVKNNTSIGRQAKTYMDRGELVPDEIVTRMITERLEKKAQGKGFILDGFPRTKQQAEILDGALASLNVPLQKVIYFRTNEQTILKRLAGRRICRTCGRIFHITNIPPAQEGICDYCRGPLYQRQDDTEETIKKRLRVYNEQTKELIDYYKKKNVLEEVSGDLDVQDLFSVLKEIFHKAGLA